MTGPEMMAALGDMGGIVVVSRSGKLYYIEHIVIKANASCADPYIYGWPPKVRRGRKPIARWFYARNVRLAEGDDQVDI